MSLRVKLGASRAALSLVIAVGVAAMALMQLEAIESAALLEAEHFADVIALSVAGSLDGRQSELQTYAERLHNLYKRDLVIVDRNKKGIADTDHEEFGELSTHDRGNEVALTG